MPSTVCCFVVIVSERTTVDVTDSKMYEDSILPAGHPGSGYFNLCVAGAKSWRSCYEAVIPWGDRAEVEVPTTVERHTGYELVRVLGEQAQASRSYLIVSYHGAPGFEDRSSENALNLERRYFGEQARFARSIVFRVLARPRLLCDPRQGCYRYHN
jgi:hypothetical protein